LIVAEKAPVAVVIPTYNRGSAVVSVLDKVLACDPQPAEFWVHIDQNDGVLERHLMERFPGIHILTSPGRLGPGGGRHRCLLACGAPYAVSLDDDSWPVDPDFFAMIEPLFSSHPRAAIFGASIWHRAEAEIRRSRALRRVASYVGCGHAVRVAAYRDIRGYLARPMAYAIEEGDVGLQLFVKGWQVFSAEELRVFHDTDRSHHEASEVTASTITNLALLAFLHYPAMDLGRGAAQVANRVAYSVRRGRIRGVASGVGGIVTACYRNRTLRAPIRHEVLREYLRLRQSEADPVADSNPAVFEARV
jgi:GT2 family glycosyltransferase